VDAGIARLTAAGRIAFGAGFLLNPRLSMRSWIGRDSDLASAQVLTRALGARDLVLGVGTLASLEAGQGAERWLQASLVGDATDLLATLAHRRELPRGGGALVIAVAGTAVALGIKSLLPDRPAPSP
jgi:hypothetical protein